MNYSGSTPWSTASVSPPATPPSQAPPSPKANTSCSCLSLADRDPATYPNPTALQLDRPPNPGHLAFGYGPHRCLGARIASHTLTAALREWHRQIPTYTIPPHTTIHTGGELPPVARTPPVWGQ
jgi:cytochrome P450